jgi:hypothetical protein
MARGRSLNSEASVAPEPAEKLILRLHLTGVENVQTVKLEVMDGVMTVMIEILKVGYGSS